jgi:hypothetical protein
MCIGAALGIAAGGAAAPGNAQVVISEILGDPSRDWDGDSVIDFKDDEWVEIANIGATTAVLDSLRLSDASDVFRFGFTGTLAPGEQRVVYGSESVTWETAHGASTVGLSLNNGGDTVRLWQLAGAETLLVDAYTYAAHEAEDDRSTGRMPIDGDVWHLFDAFNPWTGSLPPAATSCAPTPGEDNQCATPVQGETWTRVKQLFRDANDASSASVRRGGAL